MRVFYHTIESPIGLIELFEQDEKLIEVRFKKSSLKRKTHQKRTDINYQKKQTPLLLQVESQLREYFTGKRKTFSLPLGLGGTEFQKRAWKALSDIPYGMTISYSEQAVRLGGEKYCRAVGQANHRNPISIVIPCHRVIGKNGALTGYGGGLNLKEWLIDFEARTAAS